MYDMIWQKKKNRRRRRENELYQCLISFVFLVHGADTVKIEDEKKRKFEIVHPDSPNKSD